MRNRSYTHGKIQKIISSLQLDVGGGNQQVIGNWCHHPEWNDLMTAEGRPMLSTLNSTSGSRLSNVIIPYPRTPPLCFIQSTDHGLTLHPLILNPVDCLSPSLECQFHEGRDLFVTVTPSESVSCSVVSNSLWPHGLQPARLLCPWNFPGKNTGVGCHALLQRIFPTLGSNPGLLYYRQILCHLSHQGSPTLSEGAQYLLNGWMF